MFQYDNLFESLTIKYITTKFILSLFIPYIFGAVVVVSAKTFISCDILLDLMINHEYVWRHYLWQFAVVLAVYLLIMSASAAYPTRRLYQVWKRLLFFYAIQQIQYYHRVLKYPIFFKHLCCFYRPILFGSLGKYVFDE